MAKKRDYEPQPEVPESLRERYATMLDVLQGRATMAEGARRLKVSRVRFQTLLHRGLKALLVAVAPGAPGRPAKPAHEAQLERENRRLQQENERLRERGEMIDRLLAVATGVSLGRLRAPRKRRTPKAEVGDEPEEPDGRGTRMKLAAERRLRAAGASAVLAAALAGTSAATVRRWRRRTGMPVPSRRRVLSAELCAEVESLVRAAHGMMGADALSHAVPGVSRREAAAVKQEVLTRVEQERQAQAMRVVVTTPGVMRGFDAMQVATGDGAAFALVAADAAVPFRTSAAAVPTYDGDAVAETLEHDFADHGAPLVLRADRARAHETSAVGEVMKSSGVLLLHGPPHHPGYYGQLERQNREHRCWLEGATGSREDLDRLCDEMLLMLNSAWPRRSLGWRTSEEVWLTRPALIDDRGTLRAEVEDRAARIRRQAAGRAATAAMAERLAIEWALQKRGYLRLEPGGWS